MKWQKYLGGFILAILMLSFVPAGAQNWKQRKADEYYERFDYDNAIPLYEALKDKSPEVYRRLAHAYDVMGKKEKSASWYEQLIKNGNYKPEDIYMYAYYLRVLGKYEEAGKWMRKYAKLRPGDTRAKRFMANPDYYKELLKANPGVELKNVSINGSNADFGPVFYLDSFVVFTSSRGFGKVWGGNVQPYLDLYKSKVKGKDDLEGVEKFRADVNKKYHDGPVTFNAAGDYMVVTRNIYNEKNLEDNKLWLYESHKDENGKWDEPQPLAFNDKSYSCGHGALSPDGNTLYFVSDMPGGMGGTDLYVVRRQPGGDWGTPVNMGPKVNTEGKEMFPYYDARGGYLFYASDGLPGLGALDIFAVKMDDEGHLSDPVNLGAPINGNYDDFALTYKNSQENGFMSSNRPGGKGDDDIYGFDGLNTFKKKAVLYYLAGRTYDETTGEPVASTVEVYESGKLLKKIETPADGSYRVVVDPSKDYVLKAQAPGYEHKSIGVSSILNFIPEGENVLRKDIPLLSLKEKEAKDLCSYHLAPIYYDLDKYYIRPQDTVRLNEIVRLMKQFPEMRLLIESHTDSRATKRYNIRLSRNRAISAKRYIVKHGIEPDRIELKWYGESRPVNECVDGVKCSEAKHQLNRRSEFTILNCRGDGEEHGK